MKTIISHTSGIIILVSILLMIAIASCSTTRKGTRKKDCDCPRWSITPPANPSADERV
ncbi:MAG: hypothetical protein ACLFPE_03700 [Bacteroidales bacterium]